MSQLSGVSPPWRVDRPEGRGGGCGRPDRRNVSDYQGGPKSQATRADEQQRRRHLETEGLAVLRLASGLLFLLCNSYCIPAELDR
jgi:hypothetical protein